MQRHFTEETSLTIESDPDELTQRSLLSLKNVKKNLYVRSYWHTKDMNKYENLYIALASYTKKLHRWIHYAIMISSEHIFGNT